MPAALLLAAVLLAPAPRPVATPAAIPPPATAAERAERLETALGTIHGRASPAAWRALGPEALDDLERIARDPSAFPSRRAKAIEGISWIGGARAMALLRELASQAGLPFAVRTDAIRGAGRLLPASEVMALLRPVLQETGRAVDRAVAAEVLAGRAPAACAEIRTGLARERAADRAVFDRALGRCAAQGR
jgi:hypothetical protein